MAPIAASVSGVFALVVGSASAFAPSINTFGSASSPAVGRATPATGAASGGGARWTARAPMRLLSSAVAVDTATRVATAEGPTTSSPPSNGKDGKKKDKRLLVQLGEKVVDLTGWRAKHPAGEHWIDAFDGGDATDQFTAFHSEEAMQMVSRMPAARGTEPKEPSEQTKAFREFRAQLVKDGWFKRKAIPEAFFLSTQLLTYAAGVVVAKTNPWLGTLILAVGHTTCGWLAHDYVHGRGKWPSMMRNFGAVFAGLSSKWWSEKHNKHHAHTNVVGTDEDIMTEPAVWWWAPDAKRDTFFRKWQHIYWPLPFSLTFALWRVDSIRSCFKFKNWDELACLGVHYALLFSLVNPAVAGGHMLLGGALTATIVTVTHTAEDYIMPEDDVSFVDAQFRTSRDAKCNDPVSEYVWGGMQYQLEHHLFPTMPRYKYAALRPLVQKFAKDNGLMYRISGQWKIIAESVQNLKEVAQAPLNPDSRSPGSPGLANGGRGFG